jgi:hypothetical protein
LADFIYRRLGLAREGINYGSSWVGVRVRAT